MYTFPAAYFLERYPPSDESPFFVGCERVHYGDDSYTSWLINGKMGDDEADALERAATRTLVTKAKCWGHEREFRTVASHSRWAMEFEPNFLSQIIFGLRTPEKEKLKVAAIALAKNPNVAFLQAKIDESKDFGLDFVEVMFLKRS